MNKETATKKLEKVLDLFGADVEGIMATMANLGLEVTGEGHDCPEVTIDEVQGRNYKQSCVVKVGDNIVFDGVSRDILLSTGTRLDQEPKYEEVPLV